ncbi:hypothetical protein ABZ927_18165 [Streptomyces massasporeus]
MPGDVSRAGYDDIPVARDLHVRTALERTPAPRTNTCCWARTWW